MTMNVTHTTPPGTTGQRDRGALGDGPIAAERLSALAAPKITFCGSGRSSVPVPGSKSQSDWPRHSRRNVTSLVSPSTILNRCA
jgi:hypothetical protein